MKKIFATISILLIFINSTIGQDTANISNESNKILPAPKVDRRVELLSIVFRLAGSYEYNFEYYKSYVKDIHDHFDKFKEHPLIKFAKELHDKNNVCFGDPMYMAVYLEQPPSLKPIIPFTADSPNKKWGVNNANKFVSLLQQFYTDANCDDFFNKHEKVYKTAEYQFKKVYDALDLNWYKEYYGKMPDGKFNILIGLSNGPCNYGPRIIFPDNKKDIYAIMGTKVDSLGKPEYDVKGHIPTLIHEFNHSFCNPLIDKNKNQIEKFGKIIFKQVETEMSAQAYGSWDIMMYEALVRASVIRYLMKHDTDKTIAEKEINTEFAQGFIWIRELVELLGQYEKKRTNYPTIESFMPQIISFYQSTAKNIKILKANYNKKSAHVISIQQFENKSKNVDPKITEIKICFDKTLRGEGSSIFYKNNKNHYPITDFIGYTDDNEAIILKVALKPNWKYLFVLTGHEFKTVDGYSLERYVVKFKTRK